MNVDEINSTDEEDFESTQSEAYQSISLAPAPASLWPPLLAVGPKELSKPKIKVVQAVEDARKSEFGANEVKGPPLESSSQSQGL